MRYAKILILALIVLALGAFIYDFLRWISIPSLVLAAVIIFYVVRRR
jgi:hypothetical protein